MSYFLGCFSRFDAAQDVERTNPLPSDRPLAYYHVVLGRLVDPAAPPPLVPTTPAEVNAGQLYDALRGT